MTLARLTLSDLIVCLSVCLSVCLPDCRAVLDLMQANIVQYELHDAERIMPNAGAGR